MLLTQEITGQINQIQSYDDSGFVVNGQKFRSSLILAPEGAVQNWHIDTLGELNVEAIAPLAERAPALVLIGTGRRQRFPPMSLLEPLINARIGFEIMDTGSACRTFNLLAAEGRSVLAAMLPAGAV